MTVDTWLTREEVAQLLGVTPSKVRRLLEDRYVCGIKDGHVVKIPELFFKDNEPVPALRGTITLLDDAGMNDQEIINWLFAEDQTLPGRPIDHLRKGAKAEVRRRAQALAL